MKKLLLAALFAVSSLANATTLTFDDLAQFQSVGTRYTGLTFTNFTAIDTTQYQASGYVNGMVSPKNIVFAYLNQGQISSQSAFTFNSAYLASAWNNGQDLVVTGWYKGVQLYSTSMVLNTKAATLATFNWTGVDNIRFATSGGTSAGYSGGGEFFAMDNLTINAAVAAVPEPGSLALLGLGVLGFAAARRRQAAK